MWHRNQTIVQTFTTHHAENGHANIDGIGWRKIKTGAADGVTNVFYLLTAAKANGRTVDVFIVDDLIERASLN
jgi:hypothetical protein